MAKLTQNDLKRMTPEKREAYLKQKRRVERNRKILSMFVCAVIVALTVVVLSLTVLFKVDTIKVKGESIYDETQIINASGVSKGDNLILTNLEKASDGICKNLPYITKAEVEREFPSSIIIKITSADAYMAVKTNSGTALVDKNGKVLEFVAENKVNKKTIKLESSITFSKKIGESIFDSESLKDKKIETLKLIIDTINSSNLKNITGINIKSLSNIYITYDNRLKLNIGSTSELEYKLKSAVEVIKKEDEIDPNEKGEVFLSNTDNIYVSPEK